jgi:hypothetical protein
LETEPGSNAVSSSFGAVVEVDHAAAETALVQPFELHADVVGEDGRERLLLHR